MIDPRRRAFLRGRVAQAAAPQAPAAQRPPWAVTEDLFAQRCTRCDACITACPRGVLKRGDGHFPEVDFSAQGCDFCGACAAACASGALGVNVQGRHRAELAAATAWPHWQVHIESTCLAQQHIECRICADACDTRAIRFQPALSGISQMRLDLDACTACGECVAVCPVGAARIKTVSQ
ncbi:ferredoxin-type protein NapF [Ottowia sp.]|uniref:ferredoxin-type protein NapF n=1 Tax=Ottowia sp. TaxID=1898956 RepID=UPI003A8983BF